MRPHMDVRTGIFDDPVEFGCLWVVGDDQCGRDREDPTEWFCDGHGAEVDDYSWQLAAAQRYADDLGLHL